MRALLGLLLEQPLHPHAMAVELRERALDRYFKLTTGSLYDTVRGLVRDGWIEADGTEQVGARPARTVYRHTSQGRRTRADALDAAHRAACEERGVPRLFVIEAAYARTMARAELDWVERVAAEIEDATLTWPGRVPDA